MSANNGTDGGFYSIADIHQDLNINGAGPTEFEFMSGYSRDTMLNWKQYMDYILFGEQYNTPKQVNQAIAKRLEEQKASRPMTIYDVISAHPKLKKFNDLIKLTGYNKPKDTDYPFTIFAPIDDRFDEILFYPMHKSANKQIALLQVLRYHILPYMIEPWQLQNRKLRLRTNLEMMTIDTDFTGGKSQLLNPIQTPGFQDLNMYPYGDPYMSAPDNWFPKITSEVEVLKVIKCINGFIYIIDRPLYFPDVL
jgi:uncharacterized surface protein with fasciclin (FAS1) repeats